MQFTPKTQQDIDQAKRERAEKSIFPKGEYDYEITSAADTVSKKGNEMIALEMKVYHPDGRIGFVKDWLLESMEEKFYNFAQSAGLGQKYADGELEATDCEGRTGRVKLKIETSEEFGSKNVVQNYVAAKPKSSEPERSPFAPEKDADDDIVF